MSGAARTNDRPDSNHFGRFQHPGRADRASRGRLRVPLVGYAGPTGIDENHASHAPRKCRARLAEPERGGVRSLLFVAWGPVNVRPHLGRRVRGVLEATIIGLVVSGNVAATSCVIHTKVCETLVIQAAGPLRVYVQALSCIAESGLSWDVRVTDGSRVLHVPVADSPSLVPGRKVTVPSAGRWWLDVRMTNTDPDARCVRGETSTDPVTVLGVSATPRPTPRPTPNPQPRATLAPPPTKASVQSSLVPSSSGSPELSASGGTAIGLQVPPFEGGDLSPGGAGGSGEGSPLIVLAFFGMGLGGIELIAYAIRRELKTRRRSASPGSGAK